jgi:hypothetical protein
MKAKKRMTKQQIKEWRQLYKKMNDAERLEIVILMLNTIEKRKSHTRKVK